MWPQVKKFVALFVVGMVGWFDVYMCVYYRHVPLSHGYFLSVL